MLLIEKTLGIIDSVAQSMESVIQNISDAGENARGRLSFSAEISNLEELEEETEELLATSQLYTIEKWNGILQNEIWLSRIREYFRRCLKFREVAARFDDAVYSDEKFEEQLGEDNTIVRRYLVLIERWHRSAKRMIEIAGLGEDGEQSEEQQSCGIARRFRAFFVGVSDTDLKNLVVSRIPLPGRPKWLREKRQAVVFGKMLGLTCADMNRSFLFTGRDGKPTPLNYGHNAPTLSFSNYTIHPLIERLKAVLNMEKKRQ